MNNEEFKKSLRESVGEIVERKLKEVKPPWVDEMLELLEICAGNYKKDVISESFKSSLD